MEPLVSVCCTTYNHARYLARALDGFLAQRTDFPVEILVHDDASTDGTQDILRDYAARHPGVVLPLFEDENQYSRGVPINETFNFPRARGAYIAFCEGDDYWTDETKLARQVAYLAAHPDCTLCFTNATVEDQTGARPPRPFLPYYPEEAAHFSGESRAYSLGEITALTFLPMASFVFPRANLARIPKALWERECAHGDLRMKLYFTALGYAYYLAADTCVYREHVPGSAMARWADEPPEKTFDRCEKTVALIEDVNRFSGGTHEAALRRYEYVYYRAMLFARPQARLLRQTAYRRTFRTLPAREKARLLAKMALPAGVRRALRGR